MANINLNVDANKTFGDNLPNVFVSAIEIRPLEGYSYDQGMKVDVTLDIKFTIPKELFKTDIKNFISEELERLYLYAWINPLDIYNRYLQEGTMSMAQFRHVWNGLEIPSGANLHESIPLKELVTFEDIDDLLGEVSDYDSTIISSQAFDDKGNEIFSITNIKLAFKHVSGASVADGSSALKYPLSAISRYFLIAAVGYQQKTGETILSDRLDFTSYVSDITYGNITYSHFLEDGEVANRFYRQYVSQNGSPHLGKVIQNINGKFYSADNYSIEQIRDEFNAIISEYQTSRYGDPILEKNLSDLEAIIMADTNHVHVLGEIVTYQATYPTKNITTLSGQFYNKFVVAFSRVLDTVSNQVQVFPRLYIDSLISDHRAALSTGTYVTPTMPEGYAVGGDYTFADIRGVEPDGSGTTYTSLNNFINENHFFCQRVSALAKSLYESSEIFDTSAFAGKTATQIDMLVDNTGEYWTVGELGSDIDSAPSAADFGYGEYSALWATLYQYYIDEYGYAPEEASQLATDEVYYLLGYAGAGGVGAIETFLYDYTPGAGGEGTGVGITGEVYDDGATGDIYDETLVTLNDTIRNSNYVIMCDGYFMFNYEAALRTQSAISQVLDIHKLQRYLRYNVPYDYFPVDQVRLQRRELYVGVGGGVGANDIKCRIFANFQDGGTYKRWTHGPGAEPTWVESMKPTIPCQRTTGITWDPESNDKVDDMSYYRYKYLRPALTRTSGTEDLFPYLKVINFDLPNNDLERSLKKYNSLSPYTDSYPSAGKTLDGYRLMGFKFRDIMDDDVAYYNTDSHYLETDLTRGEQMKAFNSQNIPRTIYKVRVKIQDYTKSVLDDIYSMAYEVYTEYVGYVDKASQICSFNNLTNAYNDFFKDAIKADYDDREPWTKAAYWVVALHEILFNTTWIDSETFDELVLKEILKISPSTGTLSATSELATTFADLINYFTLADAPDPSPAANIIELDVIGAGEDIFFGQEIDFAPNSPITGDYFPSLSVSAEEMFPSGYREPAPIWAIPTAVYFGGRIEAVAGIIISDFGEYTPLEMLTGGEAGSADALSSPVLDSFDNLVSTAYAGYVGQTSDMILDDPRFKYAGGEIGGDTTYYSLTADGEHDYIDKRLLFRAEHYVAPSPGAAAVIGSHDLIEEAMGGGYFRDADTGDIAYLRTSGYSATDPVPLYNPDKSSLVKIAYDEILLPYHTQDWRAYLWGFTGYGGGGDGSSTPLYSTDGLTWDVELESHIDLRTRMGKAQYYWSTGGWMPSGDSDTLTVDPRYFPAGSAITYSNACLLLNEIFRRTSVDVMFSDAAGRTLSGVDGGRYVGRRRASNNYITSRRGYRDLSQAAYILSRYLIPEAQRRIDEEDTDRYSSIILSRQNHTSFRFQSGYIYKKSSSGDITAGDSMEIHRRIKEGLEYMLERIMNEINTDITVISPDTAREAATIGMNRCVNNDSVRSYKGEAGYVTGDGVVTDTPSLWDITYASPLFGAEAID